MTEGFGSRRKCVLGAQSHFLFVLCGGCTRWNELGNQMSIHQGSAGPPRSIPSTHEHGLGGQWEALEAGESASLVPNPISWMDFWAFSLVRVNLGNQTSVHQGSAGPPRSIPSACQLPRAVWVDDGRLWKQDKVHPGHSALFLGWFQGTHCLFE